MVKCKFNHVFSSQRKSVKLSTTMQPLQGIQNVGSITKCCLINNGT